MKYTLTNLSAFVLPMIVAAENASNLEQVLLVDRTGEIPLLVREHWMAVAKQALNDLKSPCPQEAFGAAIVNHTSPGETGDLICIGANDISSGNPTLHGEIAAINNCTVVLQDPSGPYGLSPAETVAAFKQLTLYTTAEPCPMCASAIRWAGFKECVFATSTETLAAEGWDLINMTSQELFSRTGSLGTSTALYGGVLANETDPLFQWQFNHNAPCPLGCERKEGSCSP